MTCPPPSPARARRDRAGKRHRPGARRLHPRALAVAEQLGGRLRAADARLANLNSWTQAKVDSTSPDRGPLLIVSGEKDHTVPWAFANASYKKQKRNDSAITEIVEMPNRGHSLTIDSGWREVCDTALEFVGRFA